MREHNVDSAERLLRLIHWSGAASRQLRRQLAEAAAAFELTDNELLVIWLCRGNGRVQVELASAIGVSPAQMSGVVERLGTRGLVAMHRPSVDRRRQVWQTSPSGQSLLNAVAPRLDALADALEVGLVSGEQAAAADLCEKLADAAGYERRTAAKAETHDQHHARQEAA